MRAVLVLVLVVAGAVAVCGVPAGFTTYFYADDCPTGWSPLITSRGRLIVSVADPAHAGVTVNAPLAPNEDRAHNHTWQSTADLPSKSVAAIDCCNDSGACNGQYDVGGTTQSATSACRSCSCRCAHCSRRTPTPCRSVRSRTSPSFSAAGCPAQWAPLTEANGRALVPGYADKGIVTSSAAPLASGEDRAHTHAFRTAFHTVEVSYEGVDGCCNHSPAQDGQYTVAGNSSADSSGLPYLQLLTCLSQAPTFDANFPAATLLFNEVGCPPNWNVSIEAAGRFVVALPEGGEAGVTFGRNALTPGQLSDPTHAHDFEGEFTAKSCGVGLASGCCGGGYAAAQTYSVSDVTADAAFEFPYLSVPMCIQL